ncbi:hypothetical protein HGH93_21680 [Chitinophaga polysaccharea]|uniref:hypothetical protein n=1 Tax=Chitinophaga polysaccharea TaxID=1293035 RepID=UPI001454EFE7|nr:hypothetical protein [Chitinophaga polysaccharea]NLR60736.1 hypothetical protein [Chitinophaga polysaccharea]
MTTRILPAYDVRHYDQLLFNDKGQLNAVDAYDLHQIHHIERQIWAHNNSVYHFITKEMIQWLGEIINDRPAIEICGGNGGIGRHLGIPSTDSYMQTWPHIIDYYLRHGQRPIFPPKDVLEYEANKAVDTFQPKVVIGAFVTQKYKHTDVNSINPGSLYGVDEEELLKKVETYVMLGNKEPHKGKRIFKLPHRELRFPWQITRSIDPSYDRVWIWDKRELKKDHYDH